MSLLSLRVTTFLAVIAAGLIACSSSTTSTTSGPSGGTADAGATGEDAGVADTDGGTTEDSATAAPFALTSTALAEGATFPVDNTCTGKNVSPPFAWGPGPEGTKSYAIVLHDTANDLLHAMIYDIPATVTALPADVEQVYAPKVPAGAHQTKNYKGLFGYAGPCPTTLHVYEFVLYALDVAALPGVSQNVAIEDAETALKAHSLGTTKLTGKYKKP